jgi:DNA-binding NarL/FixJ family response regulator
VRQDEPVAAPGWSEVTSRERGVLSAVERRLTNTEIGAELHISVRTVESHISSLRRKLGADAGTIATVRGVGYRYKRASSTMLSGVSVARRT